MPAPGTMASLHPGSSSPWASTDSGLLHHEPRRFRDPEPLSARLIGILFTLFTAGVCASLFSHRVAAVRSWTRLPYIRWLVILQYAGAFVYTIFSSIIQYGFRPDDDPAVCNASAAVCITLYAIMKGLLYLFLADRLHVVRSTVKSRKQSRLFLVHTIGIGVCIVVLAAVFIHLRLYYIDNDVCVIGVQRVMMVIGVTFDVLINTYLTGFFLYYLSKAFNIQPFRTIRGIEPLSSNDRAKPLEAEIRTLTKRTTIGLGITLIATITNLVTMTIMDGEVLWLCFLTCKADILLCVLVLHYMSTAGRRRIRPNFSSTERSVRSGSVQGLNNNMNLNNNNKISPLKENSLVPSPRGTQRTPTFGGLDMESIPAHLIGIKDAIEDDDDRDTARDASHWRKRDMLQHPASIHGNAHWSAKRRVSDAV